MPTDTGVPPNPDRVADRLAIQDILAYHSRGLDRGDSALVQECYWAEASVDYGSFKGPAEQFAQLVVPVLQENYELTRHCLSNNLLRFSGDVALSESNVEAAHLLPGAAEEMLFAGRYLDRLEKRDGRWKMMHRQVVVDWVRRRPVEDERETDAFAALARGTHSNDDPLYNFLESDHE